jgi:hypothetical protein
MTLELETITIHDPSKMDTYLNVLLPSNKCLNENIALVLSLCTVLCAITTVKGHTFPVRSIK